MGQEYFFAGSVVDLDQRLTLTLKRLVFAYSHFRWQFHHFSEAKAFITRCIINNSVCSRRRGPRNASNDEQRAEKREADKSSSIALGSFPCHMARGSTTRTSYTDDRESWFLPRFLVLFNWLKSRRPTHRMKDLRAASALSLFISFQKTHTLSNPTT